MDIRKLQRAIVDGLEDVKAHNIVVFNTEHLTPLFERVIVASGTSNRQTKALASSVRETVKARGMPVLSTEGADNGEWIIVDCGAAVAHIMQPAIRDYYRLEEIWGGKPVKVKLLDGRSGAAALRESEDAAATKPRRRAEPKASPSHAAAAGGEQSARPRVAAKPGGSTGAHAAARKASPRKSPARRDARSAAIPKGKAPSPAARRRRAAAKKAAPAKPAKRGSAKSLARGTRRRGG